MGLSSNILWHQTNKMAFYDILTSKKLLYSYSLEKTIFLFQYKPIAFPMISVSDFPFSEISNNKWTYGNYCIGFNQKWGVKVGFSPVWYCSSSSHCLLLLNSLLEKTINSDFEALFKDYMFLFANVKFNQASLSTNGHTFKEYCFYDEREWRAVPYITEKNNASIMPFLNEDAYKDFKNKNNGRSLLNIGIDFQYDDINYIIVESETDIKKTREIVGDRCHIFTKNEVYEDMIGIEHHKEIQASQEKMESEAAARYVDRLMKQVKNVRNSKKEERHKKKKKEIVIEDTDGDEWVNAEEAARILGLSKDRIYHIKNHLTHRKGNSKKSRLFFQKSKLFEDYMNM